MSSPLESICAVCGTRFPAGSRFCPQCGTAAAPVTTVLAFEGPAEEVEEAPTQPTRGRLPSAPINEAPTLITLAPTAVTTEESPAQAAPVEDAPTLASVSGEAASMMPPSEEVPTFVHTTDDAAMAAQEPPFAGSGEFFLPPGVASGELPTQPGWEVAPVSSPAGVGQIGSGPAFFPPATGAFQPPPPPKQPPPTRPPLSRWLTFGGAGVVTLVLALIALSGLLPGSDWAAGGVRAGIAALIVAGLLLVFSSVRYLRGARARRTLALAGLGMALLVVVGGLGLGLQTRLHQAQGSSLQRSQQFAQAIQEYRLAQDIQGQANTYFDWGKQLYAQKHYEQAIDKFTQALTFGPPTAFMLQVQEVESRAYEDWGNQFYAQKDYKDAIDRLQQALSLAQSSNRKAQVTEELALVHEDWGVQLLGQGQYGEAVGHFVTVIGSSQKPDLVGQAKNNLVQTYQLWGKQLEMAGSYSDADSKLKSALQYASTPDQMQQVRELIAGNTLAWGDFALGKSDFQGAITVFTAILQDGAHYGNTAAFPQIHLEAAKAYFGLGMQQEASGNCTAAMQTFNTLISQFGDTPQAGQAANELQKPQDIKGRIVNRSTGQPAAGVRLFLSANWSISILGFTATNDYSTVSDGNGNFTFAGIPQGDTVYLISYIGQDGRETVTVITRFGVPESAANTAKVHPLCPTDAGTVEQF